MADHDQPRSNRGFASMDQKKQREIASKGGRASGGNFKNDPERASEAGRKGGQSVPASERSFSRNPELAAAAGRKGGEHSHAGSGARTRSSRTAAVVRAIGRQQRGLEDALARSTASQPSPAADPVGQAEPGNDRDKEMEMAAVGAGRGGGERDPDSR